VWHQFACTTLLRGVRIQTFVEAVREFLRQPARKSAASNLCRPSREALAVSAPAAAAGGTPARTSLSSIIPLWLQMSPPADFITSNCVLNFSRCSESDTHRVWDTRSGCTCSRGSPQVNSFVAVGVALSSSTPSCLPWAHKGARHRRLRLRTIAPPSERGSLCVPVVLALGARMPDDLFSCTRALVRGITAFCVLVDMLVPKTFLFASKLLRLWLLEPRSIAAVPLLTVSLLSCCASSAGALSRRAFDTGSGWWSSHDPLATALDRIFFCFSKPLKRHNNVKATVSKPLEKGTRRYYKRQIVISFLK
jgi:hypothetical protein